MVQGKLEKGVTMSIMDGKFHVATEKYCNAPWGGSKQRFRCYLCGYKFKVGDFFRIQYTNDISGYGGNPLICEKCNGPDVIDRWKAVCDEYNSDKFWSFRWD